MFKFPATILLIFMSTMASNIFIARKMIWHEVAIGNRKAFFVKTKFAFLSGDSNYNAKMRETMYEGFIETVKEEEKNGTTPERSARFQKWLEKFKLYNETLVFTAENWRFIGASQKQTPEELECGWKYDELMFEAIDLFKIQ